MAETEIGYGYNDDNSQDSGSGMKFGANFGAAKLVKFEYTATGGSQGAAQDALDIVININGKDKNYRMFPVTKVFKNNVQLENTHPDFKTELQKALAIFNGTVTHILKCFVDENVIKAAVSKKTNNFKEFVGIYQSLLPQGFQNKPLDIFLQWQYSITGSNSRTFLEIPKNVKHGKFLVPAQSGNWTLITNSDGSIHYTNEQGQKHPFERSEWFMNSKFATTQKEGGEESSVPASVNMDSAPDTQQQSGW